MFMISQKKLILFRSYIFNFILVKGTVWWVILTFTWLLAAAFKWAKEAIEKHSTLYHSVALLLPALQTTAAVLHRKVEGDNITGRFTFNC